ncbi:MAG TPA: glycosyltransferase, partial [Paracoccus sp. (in: a-proteobacteria)]|nr:glycosyltransferase [Paracoccus sp. (in: a-proteobacteria)]
DGRTLGQILLDDGAVDPENLLEAMMMGQGRAARLQDILLAQGWVNEAALARARARQWRTSSVDPAALPPDTRLIDRAGASRCLAEAVVPWRRVADVTFVATPNPEDFAGARPWLEDRFGTVRMLVCGQTQAREAILSARRTALVRQAESCVAADLSCRPRADARPGRIALALMGLLAAGLWLAPVAVLAAVSLWVTLTLAATTALKALAFRATLAAEAEARSRPAPAEGEAALPVISVMVPMFREEHVAERLVTRLSRLTYARELTDCILVVEECDDVTRAALQEVRLPHWMRVVTVPDGPIRTKPRALNYALNFCRGDIIGVWDAEDRPEPDQLHKVAAHFGRAAPDVACLQGALDYYNPRTNWLARCFTVEYSAWFRGVLPGLARMGLVVPLGGTTFFIRRAALDHAGGWDAWNVTEDADLGARLARLGYRTEIVDTTTHEEANCRAVPWVKQRSRWLKGFAMTWGVHMRQPHRLWRDLGPARFAGFHLQMFATVQQFLLAPVLWSFWLLCLGLPHPLSAPLSAAGAGWIVPAVVALFALSEMLNIGIGIWSVRRTHRHLVPWVPTLYLYFPLACLAAWKAAYEIAVKPFYWDKTAHGVFDEGTEDAAADAAPVASVAILPLLSVESVAGKGRGTRGESQEIAAAPASCSVARSAAVSLLGSIG